MKIQHINLEKMTLGDFPSGAESTYQGRRYRRHSFDPWVGKISRGGNGNPLQYCCLENSIDSRAWQAIVHGVCSDTTETNNKTNKGKNNIGTIY